jgi:hypothetical protein
MGKFFFLKNVITNTTPRPPLLPHPRLILLLRLEITEATIWLALPHVLPRGEEEREWVRGKREGRTEEGNELKTKAEPYAINYLEGIS